MTTVVVVVGGRVPSLVVVVVVGSCETSLTLSSLIFLPLLVSEQLPRFFPSVLSSYRSRYAGSGTFHHVCTYHAAGLVAVCTSPIGEGSTYGKVT